jgi:hypothetical protein
MGYDVLKIERSEELKQKELKEEAMKIFKILFKDSHFQAVNSKFSYTIEIYDTQKFFLGARVGFISRMTGRDVTFHIKEKYFKEELKSFLKDFAKKSRKRIKVILE